MTGTLIVEGQANRDRSRPVRPKFPLPLRIPKVLTGSHITIPVKQANVRILPHGPKTRMWTYDGMLPRADHPAAGGAQDARSPSSTSCRGSSATITVHLHGDHHRVGERRAARPRPDQAGRPATYDYPLTDGGKPEPAAFDFYHDHRMGETGRNNWNGLQGMFIIDATTSEERLHLPTGEYDVPLMVADRRFDNLNQLTEPFATPSSATARRGPTLHPATRRSAATSSSTARYPAALRCRTRSGTGCGCSTPRTSVLRLRAVRRQSFTQIGTGDGLLPQPGGAAATSCSGPSQRADVDRRLPRPRCTSRSCCSSSPAAPTRARSAIGHRRVRRSCSSGSARKAADHESGCRPRLPSAAADRRAERAADGRVDVRPRRQRWHRHVLDRQRPAVRPAARSTSTVPLGSTQTWLLVNVSTDHALHPPARGAVAHDPGQRAAAAAVGARARGHLAARPRRDRSRSRRSSPTTPASS